MRLLLWTVVVAVGRAIEKIFGFQIVVGEEMSFMVFLFFYAFVLDVIKEV